MRGWIADLVRQHRIGYVAEGRDIDGLVNAIIEAAKCQHFEEMGARARQLAEKEFSRDLLAQKFEQVFREAVIGDSSEALLDTPRFRVRSVRGERIYPAEVSGCYKYSFLSSCIDKSRTCCIWVKSILVDV